MVTPKVKREVVIHLMQCFQVSERWACPVLNVERSLIRYCSTWPADADLRTRLWPFAYFTDTSNGGHRLAWELDRIIAMRGKTHTIVSDNGTEVTSNALLTWQGDTGINWHYIAPDNQCKMDLLKVSMANWRKVRTQVNGLWTFLFKGIRTVLNIGQNN